MLNQIVTVEHPSSGDKADAANVTAPHEEHFIDASAAAVGFVGRSRAARECLKMIRLVAASRCNPVLIMGETGTGKELAARAFTLCGTGHPFVAVNWPP